MRAEHPAEALYIACEMEKRAIRLYERALTVFADSPCRAAMSAILADERRHLEQFSHMGGQAPGFERAQLLAAQAAGVLFSGGLMEAQRRGAFASEAALYRYAAEEEKDAIRRYGEFAALGGPAAAAFSAVQREETRHLLQLNEWIAAAQPEDKVP